MQIFRSLETHAHKTFPRTRKMICSEDTSENPFLYNRGFIVIYKKGILHLFFNIPEALTSYTSVFVLLINLSTGDKISISQTERQDVILNPHQRYQLSFSGSKNPNGLESSLDQYIYEFEPEPQMK